jgi:acetylornithine/succinyldiaminopimelate/putrescine aminotransferase
MVPKVRAAQRAAAQGAPTRITNLASLEDPTAGTLIAARPTAFARTDPAMSSRSSETARAIPPAGVPAAPGASAPRDEPPADAAALIAQDRASVLQNYIRPPLVFTHGQGAWLFEAGGDRYLDFHAGIAVTALGHADPALSAVIAAQADRLTHTSNLHYTPPYIRLADALTSSSFADRVFFTNAGGEAIEGAIKFARKRALVSWQAAQAAREADGSAGAAASDGDGAGDTGTAASASTPRPAPNAAPHTKTRFVAFERAFHGRSAGALSLTHKAAYREPFLPLLSDVTFVPFNDLDAAAAAIDGDTCAVFVEPVQGEGGYHPATLEFMRGLRRLCDENAALLVLDEIQCGVGRTGHLWAYEAYGITPDILCAAKPLANGLPIGAILMSQHVADAIVPGDHGSTFAGGPLVCRAAEHVFGRVSTPAFLAEVRRKGELLVERLHAMESDHLVDVRGSGLMIGAEFDLPIAPLVAAMRERRVLTLGAGTHTLRLCPPLVVDDAQINHFVDTLAACLEDGVLEV